LTATLTAPFDDDRKFRSRHAPSLYSWHRYHLVFGKFQDKTVAMNAKLRVDKLGRIVLPKLVRDQLQLAPDDQLELETLDDRITLRPSRGTAQLRKKHGVWVFHCGEPLSASTVEETLGQVRRERDERTSDKTVERVL
jgi:AbrB family looped-hinge helix DNA binding protein